MTTGQSRVHLLALAPRLTLLLLVAPVLAGVAGTLWPAFGLPVGGSLTAFRAVLAWPGFGVSAGLSVVTGVASTVISLLITLLIVAALSGGRAFGVLRHLLSPLLAVPHAAAALGLAFLIAPSGWIARMISPWATGWSQPPDLLILNDPGGLALIFGLVAKEVPFLLLMALAALPQTDAPRRMLVAQSLGYGRVWGFVLTVLPPLYRQLRLPVYAVLTYAMTAVEMAMILGPTLPPSLSVQITHWMTDPSLTQRPTAAAAAVLQLGLVLVVLALWHLAERLGRPALLAAAGLGLRGTTADAMLRGMAGLLGGALALVLFAGLAGLGLWSLAGLWPFPNALPASLSLTTWTKAAPDLWATTAATAAIALMSTGAALALVLACLEAEYRHGLRPGARALWLLYLPLLVPQIAFLPGLQVLALLLSFEGQLWSVAAVHLVFVLPYVFLSLSPAYHAWDARQGLAGASLGASANRIFWRLRLPMLLPAVLTSVAVGVAVSVGQYLPSLLIGGGRVETLTTEAVALSSGGNRRIIGAYGLAQMLLPALGFALALLLPRLVFANRRGLWTGVRG